MKDEVHYLLPFGFIGKIVHALVVKSQLKGIFEYRYKMLEDLFAKKK